MSSRPIPFTVGIEEEYQLINPITRALSSAACSVLPILQRTSGDNIRSELNLSQVEAVTPVCHSLAEARREVVHMRRAVIQAAEQNGLGIAAAGTHPFSHWKDQGITPEQHYQHLADEYCQLAFEPIFGFHVHVGLEDQAIALQVMNRARSWLSILLALSANSPFWLGEMTGYDSYRTLLWSQWPSSGPPSYFDSLQEYNALAQSLVKAGLIDDPARIYWDIRLSARFKTIEFRVADVCLTVDETMMMTGIIRGLVRTCYEQEMCGEPVVAVRDELMRFAQWNAARYGLSHELIDVIEQQRYPAVILVERLLRLIRPALEAEGDWGEILSIVYDVLQRGNGASRQRDAYHRRSCLEDVVDFNIAETSKGIVNK
jgi:carboxylate-amine ligase